MLLQISPRHSTHTALGVTKHAHGVEEPQRHSWSICTWRVIIDLASGQSSCDSASDKPSAQYGYVCIRNLMA